MEGLTQVELDTSVGALTTSEESQALILSVTIPDPAIQRESVCHVQSAWSWIEQDGAEYGEGQEKATAGGGTL